ncbi:MAG TPA: type VI secretion system tip protein TssI/VgrG [Polyangiaceae bacterium]|nr:type VI secretion system tip protein TssI/VgrG [Polyangiaceae bacterium]
MDSPFQLVIEGIAAPLRVVALEGRERMQKRSRFVIDVVVDSTTVADLAVSAGHKAVLFIDAMVPEARRPAGFVTSVAVLERLATGAVRVRVTFESGWTRPARRSRSRVFQDASTAQIVMSTLGEHRVQHELAMVSTLRSRGLAVQYRESDARFLARLLAEDGVFFFSVDPGVEGLDEKIVFADEASAYPSIGGRLPLEVRDGPKPEEHQITGAVLHKTVTQARVDVIGFDPMRPSTPSTSGAKAETDPWHVGLAARESTHEEDVGRGGPFTAEAAGWDLATTRTEQRQRRTSVLTGRTTCRRLACGHKATITGHDVDGVDGDYVFVEVVHRGRAAAGPDEVTYEATFEAVPASIAYRPRPPKRRVVQVAETATVVGAPGLDAGDPHVDAMGRVKVRFHWDPAATGTDRDSPWLRVVSPWAGQGFGTQFIPRVGMEVLVTFLGGNVDMPVVVGSLANGLAAPAFRLPESAATSGFRTRSTPGGDGYNELAFSDDAGSEVISLHAQRDFVRTVQGDESSSVGGSRSDVVGGALIQQIGGGEQKNVSGDSNVTIDGRARTTVVGRYRLEVEERADLHIGDAAGLVAEGTTTLELKRGLVAEIAGDTTIRAGGTQGTVRLDAGSTLVLAAGHTVHLGATERLVLAVGDSTLTLTSDAIELSSKKLVLQGRDSVSVQGKGPRIDLGDKAEILSKEVSILTEKGELTLNKEAVLKGESIKMKKPAPPPTKSDDPKEAKKKPFKIKVADAMHEPYGDRHYVLTAGADKLEGETGVDGDIDVEIPEDATMVDLAVWTGEYPTSPRKRWQIKVEALPAVDTPEGAQARLKNLGFYAGEPGPEWDASGKGALAAFQTQHDLPITAELDGETTAKLTEIHGE